MRPTSLIAMMLCFSACAPLFSVPIGLSTDQAGTAMAKAAAAWVLNPARSSRRSKQI